MGGVSAIGFDSMTTYFNKITLKERRKALRNHMPVAERLLWSKLRCKNIKGYKFRRQYSIDNFIIDFYCPDAKLAIEIDGESHYREGAAEYDALRQDLLERFGLTFLRFTNTEVYENLDGVIAKIHETLPPPTPPS